MEPESSTSDCCYLPNVRYMHIIQFDRWKKEIEQNIESLERQKSLNEDVIKEFKLEGKSLEMYRKQNDEIESRIGTDRQMLFGSEKVKDMAIFYVDEAGFFHIQGVGKAKAKEFYNNLGRGYA